MVAWVARQLGRPARWTETRYENLHRDDPRPGAAADRHHRRPPGRHGPGVPAGDPPGRRRLPAIGAILPLLTRLMTPGTYDIAQGRVGRAVRGDQHDADRGLPRRGPARGDGRGRAGDGPVRRRDRHGPGRGAAAQPAGAVHRAAPDGFGALYDSGDYAAALEKALDAAGYDEPAQGAGRAARPRRRRPARHRRGLLRRGHRGRRRGRPAERERHRRGPPGRHRDDPHRHLAARAGPRDGVGDAGQRRARHPGREDHAEVGRHRPDPRGRRHRRLAQPAAGRRGGPAGLGS